MEYMKSYCSSCNAASQKNVKAQLFKQLNDLVIIVHIIFF